MKAQENYRIHEYVASGFTLNYGENDFTRAAWRYKNDFRSATNYFTDVSNAERAAAIASNIAGVDRAGMAGLNTAMIPTMFMGGAPLGYGASRASLSSVVAAERTGVTFEGTLYRAVPEGGNPLDISYSVAANGRYTAPGQGGLYFRVECSNRRSRVRQQWKLPDGSNAAFVPRIVRQ